MGRVALPRGQQGGEPVTTEREGTSLADRTIEDFGEQWTRFQSNEGFYGSRDLFRDMVTPLLSLDDICGRRVAEIGSGTGRIVEMLIDAGAGHVVALEPSRAFEVLRRNVARHGNAVECLRATGDQIPSGRGFELIVSIGVLHHVPDPAPVVRAAYQALQPGGRLLVWLYGREGNRTYLAIALPLRWLARRLPSAMLVSLSRMINTALLKPYIGLCRHLPLPLGDYLVNVFDKMSNDARTLIVYDQLRPAYAKYYTRADATRLLESAEFVDIQVHHRHGYSWTVIGTKPATAV